MITAHPALILACTLCGTFVTAPQTVEDGVAPAFDGVEWLAASGSIDSPADGIKRVTDTGSSSGIPKRPRGAGLEHWAGRATLVLLLPNTLDHGEAIALAELIGRANVDRGLVVAALFPAHDDEVAAGIRERPPLSDSFFVGFASADSPWRPGGGVFAVVLGPSSERLGQVELPAGEDELIDMLHVALNRYGAPRLELDLPEPLRAAQEQYFGGDWDRARRAAKKVAKKSAKRDPELAESARAFAKSIDAFEQDLKLRLIDADSGNLGLEPLATIAAAVERGFPKGAIAKTAEEITSRQKKQMGRAMAFAAAEDFVSILPERPVLFPERASSRGKKYAKKLKAMTNRAATFEGDVTRKARALLARYEGAERQMVGLGAAADGTFTAGTNDQLTFLQRLVAIMPHPREHQLTQHGALAPASPLRDEVVLRTPAARVDASREEGADDCTRKKRVPWSELLNRVFGVDVLRCPRCGGRRHMIAQIIDPFAVRRVLGHLGLRTEPLELSLARPPTQMRFA